MIVVSDTSPITNLAAINQLHLLQQLYDCITIPPAVYDEMVKVDQLVPGAVEVQTLSWIQTQAVADSQQIVAIQSSQENIDLAVLQLLLAIHCRSN